MSSNKGARWCAAPNCSNNSRTNTDFSFFRFPKDHNRAKEWVISCRREDLINKTSSYLYANCKICSVHFEEQMFLNFLKNRLKPGAVPTLFDIPNPPNRKTVKRKAPTIRSNSIKIKKQKTTVEVK
ncbi:hypothetical protein RN001_002684 [Aquatica leii]|uniref:THAP-type domain-containing protein n=1 Tax=Aquatica leii TaxID=1421715 RepID=A0AAN7QNN4_9COLE|nr:hypothetical protein RN001_002684 [Aquatica leii]